mmetsp:Transcript_25121/g.68236  ORF Transcript_25121/g.68236 Transcript_25121/m.68236 type:complete len:207 (+) Transcript_25121:1568-2188(+)
MHAIELPLAAGNVARSHLQSGCSTSSAFECLDCCSTRHGRVWGQLAPLLLLLLLLLLMICILKERPHAAVPSLLAWLRCCKPLELHACIPTYTRRHAVRPSHIRQVARSLASTLFTFNKTSLLECCSIVTGGKEVGLRATERAALACSATHEHARVQHPLSISHPQCSIRLLCLQTERAASHGLLQQLLEVGALIPCVGQPPSAHA